MKINYKLKTRKFLLARSVSLYSHIVQVVKNPPANVGNIKDVGSILGSGRWRSRARQPTPVFLPGESYGQRSLVGFSPWGHKESDTTEQLNSSSSNPLIFRYQETKASSHRVAHLLRPLKHGGHNPKVSLQTLSCSVQFSSVTQSCPTLCDTI